MEYHPELKRNLWDQKSFGTSAKTTLPQASPRTNQQDRLKPEKPNLSYADLHHEIMRNAKDMSPKSSGIHLKQRKDRKGSEEDELVKYMFHLPSYLERGKNPKEKVLNVGVLDWGRLERWQCSHKQMPHRGGRSSVSSSNASSSFSSDASSSHYSKGYISSPPHQRTSRSALQSHLMSYPVQGHPEVIKSFGQNVAKFHDLKDSQSNTSSNLGKFIRTEKPFGKAHQEIKPEEFKGIYSVPKVDRESATLPNRVKYEVQSIMKVKMKTQDDQHAKRAEELLEGNSEVADHDVPGKHENVILLLQRDLPQVNVSGAPNLSDSILTLGQRPAESRRRSFSERSKVADIPCEGDDGKHLQMKRTGHLDAKIDKSSERSHSVPRSAKIGISPSRCRNVEDRKSAVTINKLTSNEPLTGSDHKASKVASEKVRSTSPFRRLSFSMSKIGKTSSSKEASALPQLKKVHGSAQSGSENTMAASGLEASSDDKSSATSRARSSPLRRLLDPILKSKPTNCHNIAELLPKDSISKDKASQGQPCSTTVAAPSGKAKLDMNYCRTTNVNDSFQDKKHGSPAVQALLRVAVKNGQPLFTFAVDNECDILAATLKRLSSSRKEDYSCIYTFFTIQEVKKKNGRWLNQGGKGQSHDYIPNIVAQMNVCGCHSSNLIKENYVDQFSMREFIVSSVELRQADEQTSDFQPNDELVAIVVKIPKRSSRSSFIDGYQSDMCKDLAEEAFDDNSGTKIQNHPSIINQDIGATVILPSGVHALPHKGEPPSLIQRWRSGGSCDCGGWDLGCKLRILNNWNQLVKNAAPSKACSAANQFELFCQDEVQDSRPFFSLAPFKDGIFSIEFHSSLSLLQAFSICIAVLDSRKACEFYESSNLSEEKASRETILVQNTDRTEGEVPARYVSYPPVSPVGRV